MKKKEIKNFCTFKIIKQYQTSNNEDILKIIDIKKYQNFEPILEKNLKQLPSSAHQKPRLKL